ncbi:serum paraoxonase/arylesterase [Leucosporidium creatinivorum]|uniref:Serum paraoxonase/arylesterase n=1 Tax=Leucosporidium creatinivorum TaxID=106004 RepID=A0A1Y2FJP4_9BASI|nr:serum paraoxonase/arylesterase [Leucosporidium creatinivorum]
MPSLKLLGIFLIPILGLLTQVILPRANLLGVGQGEVTGSNNGKCVSVPELQGCEDAWISPEHGVAYLPCTPLSSRAAWLPAILHLNASALPPSSGDYIAVYDFSTHTHHRLQLVGMPKEAEENLNLHAIDVYQSPSDRERLTVFINSHRPPVDRTTAKEVGANSVVEIFETRMGSKELNWVKTVQHPLMRTPNNLVAMGERSFYFSNDHRRKVHWSRSFQLLYSEPSDLIYCDASTTSPHCIVAAEDVHHPNGIARGPKDLLYSASTGEGKISVWEIQSGDHSLLPLDSIAIPRLSDNLHVDPTSGAILIATFPRVFELVSHFKAGGKTTSPTEVYRITNDTSEGQYYGNKYKIDRVFGDNGQIVSGATTAAPYKNQLLLTGVMSDKVVVCEIDE